MSKTAEMQMKIAELLQANEAAMTLVKQLTAERDQLAATVEAFRATLEYFVSQEFEWNNPNDSMIDDIHQLLELTPQQHLRGIQAEAGRAGFEEGATLALEVKNMTATELRIRSIQYAASVKAGKL